MWPEWQELGTSFSLGKKNPNNLEVPCADCLLLILKRKKNQLEYELFLLLVILQSSLFPW